MVFNLVVPNPKQVTVKDVILKELSMKRALTIPKLLNSVHKNNLNVSYHAVYQALKELKGQGVVEQHEKDFVITGQYIKSLKDFASVLEDNYSDKINLKLQPYSTVHLSLNSLNELARFIARAVYSNVFDIFKNREVYSMVQHLWLTQNIKGVQHMGVVKRMARLFNWYVLVQGDSLADQKLRGYFTKHFKANIKLGVKCAPISYTIVSNDYIVEFFIPKSLIELQRKVFYSSKDKLDLEWIEEYTKLCYLEKYKINTTITRNKELANQIKENILKHF